MTTWVTSTTKLNVKSVQKVKDFTGSSVIRPPEGNREAWRVKMVMAAADNESGPGIMWRKMRENEKDRTIWATVINKPWSHVCHLIWRRSHTSISKKNWFSSYRSDFHQKQRSAKWLHIKTFPADYFLTVLDWLLWIRPKWHSCSERSSFFLMDTNLNILWG